MAGSPHKGFILSAAVLAVALWVIGCDSSPQDVATQTPTPPETSRATPAASPEDSGGSLAAAMTVWGADAGDIRSDIPALAAGDFNADGIQDLLIGARFGDGPENGREDAGEAYVVFGSDKLPASVDLAAGEQSLTVFGSAASDNVGFSAAAADVNDDGVDDLVLGAPFARAGQIGLVYVIFGTPDLGGSIDLAVDEADVTVLGPGPGSFFGDSLATGDVNGDAVADIIVGATFAADASGARTGAVYVLFGSNGLGRTVDTGAGEFDAALFGADDLDEVGDSVASGDVSGDGIDDIIVTAEAADGPDNARGTAGEVYIVYGASELSGLLTVTSGGQDVTVWGAEANDTLGFSLASGDLDGDGFEDVIMGARQADGPNNAIGEAGEIIVVRGSKELPSSIDLALNEQDARLYGADPGDLMTSVGLADGDGDGTPELVAATAFADGPGNRLPDAGEAFLVDGRSLSGDLNVAEAALRRIATGEREGDRLGASVLGADLDGDGIDEVVLTATHGDGPDGTRPDAGQVYVLVLSPEP